MSVARPLLLPVFLLWSFALPALPLSAHEFWIEPQEYQVPAGENLTADFRNGEHFKGAALAYLDRRSARLELILGDQQIALSPRSGDLPALTLPMPARGGLAVLVHETTPSVLTYSEWEKFTRFAAHKDFAEAGRDHLAAGWPQQGFKESYTRHVKALIGVGSGAGADRAMGMETEFVALSNPYAPGFAGEMQVRLLYQGAPRADAQVEVFERDASGAVTVSLHRTDASGEAQVPVTAGHRYLFDAVLLRRHPLPPPTMPIRPRCGKASGRL